MKIKNGLFITAALFVSLALLVKPSISFAYHGQYSVENVLIGAGLCFAFFTTVICILQKISFFNDAASKLFFLLLLVSFLFSIIRPLYPYPLTFVVKIFLVVLCFAFFIALIIYLSSKHWQFLCRFIIGGMAFYLIAPFVYAAISSHPQIRTLDLTKFQKPDIKNYVVFVADETSPEYANGHIDVLKANGLHVQERTVFAAGKATINAIPSMLTNERHDDVDPCTPNTLCGDPGIDFSRLVATRTDIDVVGFYHPYCEIQGLRSCKRELIGLSNLYSESTSVFLALVCPVFNKFQLIPFCKPEGLSAIHQVIRGRVVESIDRAPFWNDGGFLYIHYPGPHPAGSGEHSKASLAAEYRRNLTNVEDLLNHLLKKLKQSFGDDFVIVITSDHPLRTDMWCDYPYYQSESCARELPENKGMVPLIVASPKAERWNLPESNVGLLAPNY